MKFLGQNSVSTEGTAGVLPVLVASSLLLLFFPLFVFAQSDEGEVQGAETSEEPEAEREAPVIVESTMPVNTDVDTSRAVDVQTDDPQSSALGDSSGSIEAAHDDTDDIDILKWRTSADLRFGYIRADSDNADGTSETDTDWRARFRASGGINLASWLIFNSRIAGVCSTDHCSPDFYLEFGLPTRTTIEDGDITFDEFYFHTFRHKLFDVAVGRLQTRFVTRAGVFAKSLDRNNGNAFNINWTDGLHATYYLADKSIAHIILQYNDKDGSGNVFRGPLDFTDDDSRASLFVAWESRQAIGPIRQRGIDITYMPKTLLKDGGLGGSAEDYITIVARASGRKDLSHGRYLDIAGEVGYAPETQTNAAEGFGGEGDVGGLAWAVYASLMNIRPGHSVGINYGRSEPGWLLSPQYRNNEELLELRYRWRKRSDLVFEFRVRRRNELEQLVGEPGTSDETDFFARATKAWGH